jgi:hypothetical protein
MKRLSLLLILALGFVMAGCGSSAPPPISVAISPNTALTIDQGQQKNFTALVTNDTASKGVTWSVSGGGTLTGSTATAVTYNAPTPVNANLTVTVTATSVADATKSASVSLTVTPPPTVTTTSPLTAGTVGAAYSVTLQASGGAGALTWSLASGTLPNGLSLSSGGVISGTPTATGTSTFTVQVADSGSPAVTVTKQLSITVNPAPVAIVTATLPNGTVQSSYSSTLQATGGTTPYTWGVTVSALPTGLTLNAATGQISGAPTTSGTSAFTATVTDSATPTAQTKSKQFSILVNPVLSVSTASLPNGTVGTAYSQQLQSSGGTAPITWSVTQGTLPAGLALNNSTGLISGTPTTAVTSNFTVQAADSSTPQQLAPKALSITVNVAPLAITTTTLSNATVGIAYNATLQSSGGTPPVTWAVTVGLLPAGLTLNTSTGAITGSPTTAGTSNFTVKATDSATPTAQTATQALSITVNASGVNNSELNGQYAFLLSGFDASGPVAIAGEFTADGAGHLTNGLQDLNRVAGVSTSQAFTGTYAIGADNRGTLTIGTSTFAFAVGSITSGVAANAHIVEFDATGTNVVGIVKKQNPTAFSVAQFSGDYAFGGASPTLKSGVAARFGVAGRFTASGGALTSVVADTDDNGTVQAIPSFTGTYTVAANGRGTITLSPPGATTPVSASCYIVSANEALMMSIDPQTGALANSLFAGSVLKQVGGPFGTSSLNGTDVISLEGKGGSASTSDVQVGLLVPAGNGTFTLTTDENNAGVITSNAPISGTYSVAGNGRVTITGAGATPPVIYLVSQDKGFVVGTDTSVTTGFFEPQVGTSFTNASLSGNYIFGEQAPVVSSSSLSSGIASPNGGTPGTISGTSDNNQIGTLVAGQAFTAPYTVSSNGRTTMGTAPDTNVMYIVSSSKAVFISTKTTKANSTITVVEK